MENMNLTIDEYEELISIYPALDKQDEKEYIIRAQQGDLVAKEQLIGANLNLVVKLARCYKGYSFDLMDLVQEGNVGLLEAIRDFDCSHDVSFSRYAIGKIRGKFTNYLRHYSTITYPADIVDQLVKINRLKQQLLTDEEINGHISLSSKRLEILEKSKQPILSLDQVLGYQDPCFDPIRDVDEELWEKLLYQTLNQTVDTLAIEDKKLLYARYFSGQNTDYRSIAHNTKKDKMSCYTKINRTTKRLQNFHTLKKVFYTE